MEELNLLKDCFVLKSFYCMGSDHDRCYGCSYCRAANKYEKKSFFIPPAEINPLLRRIPVVVNIFYGDPVMYSEETVKCLELLEESKHTGPVVIITKGDLDSVAGRQILERDWNLNIHFGLSYFGTPVYDNRGTFRVVQDNLEYIQKVNHLMNYKYKQKYTYNIEYRPIIKNINDSEWHFDTIFKIASKYHSSIAYSGLQVEKELAEKIKKENLPFEPYDGFDFGMKKNLSKDIEDKLHAYSVQYNVPIFKKTSCAITFAQYLPRDYNAHYYRPNEVGCTTCVRKALCHAYKRDNVSCRYLDKLPFDLKLVWKQHHKCRLHRDGLCKFPSPDCLDINGWLLQTDRKLTTTDVRLIKWLTGFTVDCEFVESPYMSKDWKI